MRQVKEIEACIDLWVEKHNKVGIRAFDNLQEGDLSANVGVCIRGYLEENFGSGVRYFPGHFRRSDARGELTNYVLAEFNNLPQAT